jgi:glycine/D-amino acid oxidase-like deaminating enzyme
MTEQADIVVIGSGAFGASTAFHLAALGRRVTVVDRFDLASQTSPRSAGLWQKVRHDETTTQLLVRSIEKIIGFETETGESLDYQQVGSLKLARTAEAAEQLQLEVARGKAWGIDIELVDRSEAGRRAPYINPDRSLASSWAWSDIYVEPDDLPRAYLRAAEARGANLIGGTTVTGILVRNDEVEGVATDRGEIHSPVVVDAAGAWAPSIAAMAGVQVCAVPIRHQLFVTSPVPSVSADMPIVRILDAHVYARPEHGGLLFGGFEPDPVAIDPASLPSGMDDLTLDETPLRRLAEDVVTEYPALHDARISELRGGLPTMTPDGYHIFGEADSVRGLWIMSGCLVGGHSISPAIGEAIAQWIVNGDPGYDMSRYRVSRFGSQWDDPEALREVCLWRYGRHYVTPEASTAS